MIANRSPKLANGNGVGRAVNFDCGSMVEFRLQIDPETKGLDEIGFSTNGCGYMVAAAQSLVDEFERKDLRKLHGCSDDELLSFIGSRIGQVPATRRRCLETASESFRAAIGDHRQRVIDEFRGEVALICSCFGIDEDRILSVIRETHAADADDVARGCNAGSGCGSCRMLIEDLIKIQQDAS
jgi:NAD(P)H-nitrite reductase